MYHSFFIKKIHQELMTQAHPEKSLGSHCTYLQPLLIMETVQMDIES